MRSPLILLFVFFMTREATPLSFTRTANNQQQDRRVFLSKKINLILATAATATGNPSIACAEEASSPTNRGGRPSAPLSALLPATRLKLWVDEVYSMSRNIETETTSVAAVQRINERLHNPPQLFQGEKIMEKQRTSTSAPSTAQLTTGISPVNKDQYQTNRKGLNIGNKMNAMLNQADVERQWRMLQYAESKREQGSEMRAAFNFYGRQLVFSDEYVLTAPKDERKKMIRNDELPTLTAVIASDLDRRDLYRNQFLTAIDDASAEAAYQVKQQAEDLDATDLVELINQAHNACENWFSLIAPQDVEEAIREVQHNK